jgi:hypothetical protein
MFYGSEFIYNEIPGSYYKLRIVNFETGKQDSDAGSESTLEQTWVRRKSKPYTFGVLRNTPLNVELTIASEDPIYGRDRSAIESWLLGTMGFQKFQVVQDDLSDCYYDIVFTKCEAKYVGNINRGFILHGTCSAPWATTYDKTYTKTFGNVVSNYSFDFFNNSADVDYNYPRLVFTTNNLGTSFQLINYDDANRTMLFTGLSALGETITMDNDLKTISASRSTSILSKFNNKWFRLIQGLNHLNVQGGIASFTIVHNEARKIGG